MARKDQGDHSKNKITVDQLEGLGSQKVFSGELGGYLRDFGQPLQEITVPATGAITILDELLSDRDVLVDRWRVGPDGLTVNLDSNGISERAKILYVDEPANGGNGLEMVLMRDTGNHTFTINNKISMQEYFKPDRSDADGPAVILIDLLPDDKPDTPTQPDTARYLSFYIGKKQ